MNDIERFCLKRLKSIASDDSLKDTTRVNAIKLMSRMGLDITDEYPEMLMAIVVDDKTTEHARITALSLLLDLCQREQET